MITAAWGFIVSAVLVTVAYLVRGVTVGIWNEDGLWLVGIAAALLGIIFGIAAARRRPHIAAPRVARVHELEVCGKSCCLVDHTDAVDGDMDEAA
jgi:hypothetical protein